jgi:hypothetical protein
VADINVERKGPSIWPWVIGLVVLALLIWALVEMFGDRTQPAVVGPGPDTLFVDTPMVTPSPTPGVAPTPAPGAPVAPGDTLPATQPAPGAPGAPPTTP